MDNVNFLIKIINISLKKKRDASLKCKVFPSKVALENISFRKRAGICISAVFGSSGRILLISPVIILFIKQTGMTCNCFLVFPLVIFLQHQHFPGLSSGMTP